MDEMREENEISEELSLEEVLGTEEQFGEEPIAEEQVDEEPISEEQNLFIPKNSSKSNVKFLIFAILGAVILAAILAFVAAQMSFFKLKEPSVVVTDVNPDQASSYVPTAFEKPLDPFANEPKTIVKLDPPGRLNPFKPFIQKSIVVGPKISKDPLDNIPPPPDFLVEDPTLKSLVDAKVAGILYDTRKPSAIIKIDGTDYLVHEGDVISDFFIKKIAPKQVTIKSGSNEYVAGAGESIQEDKINYRNVYNLENKFGGNRQGTYKSGFNSKGVIY